MRLVTIQMNYYDCRQRRNWSGLEHHFNLFANFISVFAHRIIWFASSVNYCQCQKYSVIFESYAVHLALLMLRITERGKRFKRFKKHEICTIQRENAHNLRDLREIKNHKLSFVVIFELQNYLKCEITMYSKFKFSLFLSYALQITVCIFLFYYEAINPNCTSWQLFIEDKDTLGK